MLAAELEKKSIRFDKYTFFANSIVPGHSKVPCIFHSAAQAVSSQLYSILQATFIVVQM